MKPISPAYIGRFAPTPSGPLHLGSLVTAAASWLDARAHGGRWLLRVDDIDPPREVPGAADTIRQQLDSFGLHWDGDVIYQSQRHARYQAAIDQLLARDKAFYCSLSRKDLAAFPGGHPGPDVAVPPRAETAIRLAVPAAPVVFDDACAGPQHVNLAEEGGAFVIRRRDGLYAYQLACAVDDAALGISHVLRGDDLLGSSARQIAVLEALGHTPPRYAHWPVVRDADGLKLSKSAGSAALDTRQAPGELHRALRCLKLDTDGQAPVTEQLTQALAQWQSPFR